MNKSKAILSILGLGCLASSQAHFTWMFFESRASTNVTVQFAESPDDSVLGGFVGKQADLVVDGNRRVRWEAKNGKIPAQDLGVVGSRLTYGVMDRDGKFLLRYHAKACRSLSEAKLRTDSISEVTLTPSGDKIRATVFLRGKPASGATFQIYDHDGKARKVMADASGSIEFSHVPSHRIALWAVTEEQTAGEFGGRSYPKVKHYATLTVAP